MQCYLSTAVEGGRLHEGFAGNRTLQALPHTGDNISGVPNGSTAAKGGGRKRFASGRAGAAAE
ncbi:hypothetical protein Ancab_014176 [Ancistrocladus abbreviatus]